MIGVGAIVIVIFCCCCSIFRDLRQRCRQGWSLTQWSPRKLPQRKYKQGKELYETCVICQEDFKNAELIRVLPCRHSKLL